MPAGRAEAAFELSEGLLPPDAGILVHHAFLVLTVPAQVSNAHPLVLD